MRSKITGAAAVSCLYRTGRCCETPAGIPLTVQDTGPGIPSEHLSHIFDRFYRVDSGRSRDQGGSGLGLNIARWIAESHGGQITVASEVGQGTTFTVRLPASPE